MATAEAERAPTRASGGGTGFLFGNIDSRGRLDEDYMDDDAKDHLDNVAPTVAERDPNLREITEAVPKRRYGRESNLANGEADAESGSDDEHDQKHHSAGAEDFFDETEIMEDMDDEERGRLASLALAQAHAQPSGQLPDDDENYDDDGDGEEQGTAEKPANPASSPLALSSTNLKSSVDVTPNGNHSQENFHDDRPSLAPNASSMASPEVNVVPSSVSKHNLMAPVVATDSVSKRAELSEEALQSELMAAARRLAAEGVQLETPMMVGKALDPLPDDKPLRFSEVLTQPRRKMPATPKRKRYGLSLRTDDETFQTQLAVDDLLTFDKQSSVPQTDPVKAFLRSDYGRRRVKAELSNGEAIKYTKPNIDHFSDSRFNAEYRESCAPLSTNCSSAMYANSSEDPSVYSLIQQVSWENEIDWELSEDGTEEEHSDNVSAVSPEEDLSQNDARQAGNAATSNAVDSDDDDMEWEDAADVSASQALPAQHRKIDVSESERPESSTGPGGKVAEQGPLKVGSTNIARHSETAQAESSAAAKFAKDENAGNDPLRERKALEAVILLPNREHPSVAHDKTIQTLLAPNRELAHGVWLRDIVWDTSASEGQISDNDADESEGKQFLATAANDLTWRTDRLILDLNDPNMIFDESDSRHKSKPVPYNRRMKYVYRPSGASLGLDMLPSSILPGAPEADSDDPSLLPSSAIRKIALDPFNISNDSYYARTTGSSMLKVDRRAILQGLRNAPPAAKAQTTIPNPSDEYLTNFHRPRLYVDDCIGQTLELIPFRRKRPKGGSSQIAGQIPKKQSELLTSTKDAFRVCLFEFALEQAPCLLPVPGMASRVVTYDRKESLLAASQARKTATGTPDADTIFMSPEEMPPLHAGDLLPNSKPLLVLESHLFSAPCTRIEPSHTDFLVVRRRGKVFVRELDAVLSVGVTEPKLEVMAPNTDRFKKFAKERVLLWLLREFLRSQKKVDGIASIDRESLFVEFTRRRTFPETSLVKMLKELSRFQNGKYVLMEEPPKGFAAMEAELIRTISPEETCAFEAMEAGWHRLIGVGVQIFTHPTTQSNIRSAAEKTGLRAGPAVGNFIWNQLLKTPWYRSQIMIAAQKQQRKEMIQALAMARIVNDLREGGAVMEARLASLTAAETLNVLSNQYKIQARKIPTDVEARRDMVRELALKRSKGSDPVNYQDVVAGIISKQRNVGGNRTAAGAGVTAAVAAGGVMIIPLDHQRQALEQGVVDEIPREEERAMLYDDVATAAKLASDGDDAFGRNLSHGAAQNAGAAAGTKAKHHLSPAKASFSKRPVKPIVKSQKQLELEEDEKEFKKMLKTPALSGEPVSESIPKKKKVRKRLKVTRKVIGPDGKKMDVVEYITDPVEVERLLAKSNLKAAKKASSSGSTERESGDKKQDSGAGASKLKIAINVRKLSEGAKSGIRKSQASTAPERKKSIGRDMKNASTLPSKGVDERSSTPAAVTTDHGFGVRKFGPKGQVGKIKINQKLVKQAQEEQLAKRKRSQYSDDLDYPARKAPRKSSTSRRKRNGTVVLNGVLEQVEKAVRDTEGYVQSTVPEMVIMRLTPGETAPPGRLPNNLARPRNSGLDFTTSVDVKTTPAYKDVVKKQMYLDLIKQKCKQMKYHSSAEFLKDMQLMLDNARAYNCTPDVKWVVRHAELLYEVAEEQIQERKEEIVAAELQVKNEKAEAEASKAPSGQDVSPVKKKSNHLAEAKSSSKSAKKSKGAKPKGDASGNALATGAENEYISEKRGNNESADIAVDVSPPFISHSELYRSDDAQDLDDGANGYDDDTTLELPDMNGIIGTGGDSLFG